MTGTIKITGLNNIGNDISPSTLVPVVDVSGTPTTEKANLQIVGNLILNGAGGANFVAAAQAINAQTVSNAAQPAITSVGTLTSLIVSGTTDLGSVANVTLTGGVSGYVLSTDGFGGLIFRYSRKNSSSETNFTSPSTLTCGQQMCSSGRLSRRSGTKRLLTNKSSGHLS